MQFPEYPYSQQEGHVGFMYKVYGYMSLALAVTASVAYAVFKTPAISAYVRSTPWLTIALIILQLVLVIVLSAVIMRLSFFTAFLLFMVYAMSVGVTFSFLFEVYTTSSIYATFLVTSLMFLITCLYGYFTKADLTSLGSFGFMALIGLIIGGVVNIFLRSSMFDFILSAFGVLVFTLLTAYDSQKIKELGYKLVASPATRAKVAIVGALTLYLDFINLFLYLLRFFGRSKD